MDIKNIKSKEFKDLSYDELYYLYITLDYTKTHIADIFDIGKEIVERQLKKYNINYMKVGEV